MTLLSRFQNNSLERRAKLFQGCNMWLKYGFDGILVFVFMATSNVILGRFFLSENEVAVFSIIKKYIGSVVIGFIFGTGPLQMMKRRPKNIEITWYRFATYFFLIGVIEAVCVLSFIFFFFFDSDIAKSIPILFFALFFPVSNFIYGIILFIVKKYKTNKNNLQV
jgi:hypothetical protein